MKELVSTASLISYVRNLGFQMSSYSQTVKILLKENTEQILYCTMLYS